ncbi:sensor histidine kinase [Oceanibaculum nanhaiense]|uniref:sensor histidine kinase n=1 Tax=Oceanibaculum nanhaiense TaxID=1909734 RepID=UPI000A3B3067|nr:PAS domain S-box protein [Oceanibaculum nanhaiense]
MKQFKSDIAVEILHHLAEAVIGIDKHHRIRFFNRSAETVFGFTREEAIGQPLDMLLPDSLRDRHGKAIDAFIRSGDPSRYMNDRALITGRRRNGILFHAEASILRTSLAGTPLMVAVLRDVTERIEADRKLRLAEARQRAILAASPDAILLVDADSGTITDANQAAGSLLGCAPGDLVGLHQGALYPAAERERVLDALAQCPDNEALVLHDTQIRRRDGSLSPVEIAASRAIMGNQPAWICFYRDITHHKERESAHQRARTEADAANRAKSAFLAHISHELRTPLNAIIGFSDMLRTRLFGPLGNSRYEEYATYINDAGQHLLTLINDVLELSRLDNNNLALSTQQTLLSDLVTFCARAFDNGAESGRVQVQIGFDATLDIDPRLMRQVLLNLLSNALKYSEAGSPVVIDAIRTPGGDLGIRVSDRGIGIPASKLDSVMQPFVQLNDYGIVGQGLGLGLSLAGRFMDLHGGRLEIESVEGEGTIVTAWLPAARLLPPADDASD